MNASANTAEPVTRCDLLTDERPPGPAFMPLFNRVIPAVSSVAKPRQALVSPAMPPEPQTITKLLPNQLTSQLN